MAFKSPMPETTVLEPVPRSPQSNVKHCCQLTLQLHRPWISGHHVVDTTSKPLFVAELAKKITSLIFDIISALTALQ